MNNTKRFSWITLLAGFLLFPGAGRAADIDIYSGLSAATGAPNVLIIMDNAANFDAATTAPACTINGATNSMAKNASTNSAGGIEQCALYSVISQLPINPDGSARVNIGFMVYNAAGLTDYTGATCVGSAGGCLVYPLAPMTGTTRTSLLNWIAAWTPQSIKVNNEAIGATMAEAWAYYAGQTATNGSGRNYATIQPAAGCQKNFVIFLGNVYSSSAHPSDSPSTAQPALTNAYTLTGAAMPTNTPILGSVVTACGVYTLSATNHENNGMYGDEWSRFMFGTDIFATSSGKQNIVTYTVGLVGASCPADYPALLSNMASYGGGKYFATSDATSIVQALLAILNEVQAVNSVFSAATLPVSVNAQGTYLNQIYMGMFRPDERASPRWVGNLKQYQFKVDPNLNLYLADATGQPAISSGGTGFISPGAASFWTCTTPTRAATLAGPTGFTPYSALPTCPLIPPANNVEPPSGIWANHPTYPSTTTGQAWDFVDGEVVEKGGVAEQLRLTNLTASYPTGTAATPDSPRKVYTWCPGDPQNTAGACIADLTNAANAFSNGNMAIMPTMLGTGLNLIVTGITRLGTTATATTSGSHGLVVGNTVTISGATPAEYNGLVTVTSVPAANKFSYTVPEWPPTPATTTTTGGVGGYTVTLLSAVGQPLASLSRTAAGTAVNATVTAVTAAANTFATGNNVTIAGASPTNYNLTQMVTVANATTFTYPVSVQPTSAPTGPYTPPLTTGLLSNYVVSLAGASPGSVTAANCVASTKQVTITVTGTGYTFKVGDYITISGDIQNKPLNGSYYVTGVTATGVTFTVGGACPGASPSSTTQVVAGPPAPVSLTALTRNETAVGTATVTATIGAMSAVGSGAYFTTGDLIVITNKAGTTVPSAESGYLVTSAPITCVNLSCTTFTYTIATTPGQQFSTTATAALAIPGQTIASLTRLFPAGTTATATLATGSIGFTDQSVVSVMTAPGSTLAAHEDAYLGNYTITCVGLSPCTTFTYGPLTLTPVSPATGSMSASNPGINPDRTALINWVRGEDNFGDEPSLCPPGTIPGTGNCPNPGSTVRPSVHADTLHSRPVAVNYGAIGTVVFYGTNDGMYHAVNGNQTASIGSVQAGGELWSFIAPDFFNKLNRQRTDSPSLLLPSTPPGIIPTPQPKDYFFDGPTGVYVTRDAAKNITRAIIYVAARRGGHFIYAMDVTNPLVPQVLWRISSTTPGFQELGQTWSLPQVAKVAGYANPLLFFGAGYDDGAEDAEPPTLDAMGRGIFVVDALTGALVWSAGPNLSLTTGATTGGVWYRSLPTQPGSACTTTTTVPPQTTCQVNGMTYSIAADLALADRNYDGNVDRAYAVDVGGNVWRLDFEPAAGNTPDKWQVTQLAQLGDQGQVVSGASGAPVNFWAWLFSGAFPAATAPWGWNGTYTGYGTPRKFFYRPAIIFAPNGYNFDAVFVGSGDREHPLSSHQASAVVNRVYMVKDSATGNDSVAQTFGYTETNLVDCTGTATNPNTCSAATSGAGTPLPYDKLSQTQQKKGYFITLNPGEKVVNAPLAAAGQVYFGTNQPTPPNPNSCNTNLGVARGYSLTPFSANYYTQVYDGGGLPPSPVSGVVTVDGRQKLFCMGCVQRPTTGPGGGSSGGGNNNCRSAVGGCDLNQKIPAVRSRTYWYIDGK